MNRNLVKRWLNEYLDGEIGLADKAELERRMAEDPELREEYRKMRQLGLLLGSQSEVTVHPSAFRQRVSEALENNSRVLFTPQRAFAMAMVVALLVIGLSMSMLVYQQGVLGHGQEREAQPMLATTPVDQGHTVVIETGVSAELYFSRLLLSYQLGRVDAATLEPVLSQTRVYDGAVCNAQADNPLSNLSFQQRVGQPVSIKTTVQVARSLGQHSLELSGRQPQMLVRTSESSSMALEDYSKLYGEERRLTVVLLFTPEPR